MAKVDAFAKAIEHIDKDTDYVIITDADFTYPAKYFPRNDSEIGEESRMLVWFVGTGLLSDLDHIALHDYVLLGESAFSFHP